MDNNTITINPGDDLSWIAAQIHQGKINRTQSAPPIDMQLTTYDAFEYLSRPCLLKHEVIALLFGTIPHPTETADHFSCLGPGDNVVIRRFLADEKAGKLTYPILLEEFCTAVMPWRNELPEELIDALKLRFPDKWSTQLGEGEAEKPTARKNSAADAIKEVKRLMPQAIRLIEAAGLDCQSGLTGTKKPYREYLKKHSSRLRGLSNDSLDDYLKRCNYHWKQTGGRREETDNSIRKILALPAK